MVERHPHSFINQSLAFGIVTDYLEDDGEFVVEYSDDKSYKYDKEQFINNLKGYYKLNGFKNDLTIYFNNFIERYTCEIESMNDLDEPNAMTLRAIKTEQQIERSLNFISDVEDENLSHCSKQLEDAVATIIEKKITFLNKARYKVIKPFFQEGDLVYAQSDKNKPSWEHGEVVAYNEYENIDGYGPSRTYTILFDSGEKVDVKDYQVIKDKEYILSNGMKESDWKGVIRVVDEDSTDRWAREVGWYVIAIDEVEQPFTHLSDALRAHDMHVVFMNMKEEEERVENRNLNFPKEYSEVLQYEIDYHFSSRIGLMLANDRLSDPIMRRIGRMLITFIHPRRRWEIEDPDRSWKLVTGHIQDGEWITNRELADYVYKLALAKQCFDPDSDTVDHDRLCSFFLCAEGCLDEFLLKVSLFCAVHKAWLSPRRDFPLYLRATLPNDVREYVVIQCKEGNNSQRAVATSDEPLTEFLANYAHDRYTSIKSLRIKYNDKSLFLSSIGRKTPRELGIKDNDVLEITLVQSISTETTTNEQSKQQSPKGKNNKKKNKKHKKSKKKRAQPLVIQKTEVELKVEHSKLLGKVYEEAEATFKEIRQRLNAMNLERTKPKQRTSPSKTAEPVELVGNPLDDGHLGGKAGKTQFIIQVGEVSNLYKTTKPSSTGRGRRQDDIMIDLHGLTAEEAVYRLNKHLPGWIDTAMKGTYPFVIPVKIICGGGSQILAEVVENWIKQNDHVANAPKNMYS